MVFAFFIYCLIRETICDKNLSFLTSKSMTWVSSGNKAVHPEIRNGRGIIEDFDEIKGGEISVRGEYNVFALPGEISVNSIKEDGRTLFNTGKVYGYKAFLLKK